MLSGKSLTKMRMRVGPKTDILDTRDHGDNTWTGGLSNVQREL